MGYRGFAMLELITFVIAVFSVSIFFAHTVDALGQATGRNWIG